MSSDIDSRTPSEYYRGDQEKGITAPDISKVCTYAEHIVRARGKRTAFTSVSLDKQSIQRFGECLWILLQNDLLSDGHALVEHEMLMQELRRIAKEEEKADRLFALRALVYARHRREGLVVWDFDHLNVERKDLINWAAQKVLKYFRKC